MKYRFLQTKGHDEALSPEDNKTHNIDKVKNYIYVSESKYSYGHAPTMLTVWMDLRKAFDFDVEGKTMWKYKIIIINKNKIKNVEVQNSW